MWLTLLSLLSKIPAGVISLFSGINVGAVFTGLGSFFSGLFANMIKYWQYWLIGLLIVGNLFNGGEWRHTNAMLIKERAAHAADIASFKKAQADADTKAQTERAVLLKESKANAAQADANYTTLLSSYHASIMRYKAPQGTARGRSDNQLSTTQGGDGSSTSTELPSTLTISGDDAQICAVNTARLQAVHDWAVSLPTSGATISK